MRVLFLLHIPPPVHGSSMVGKSIYESKSLQKVFSCRFVNILASKEVSGSGKVNLSKIGAFVFVFFRIFRELIAKRPKVCYFALTVNGAALFRDAIVVIFLKLFRVKIVYHLHNKGVKNLQDSFIYNLLYKFIFSGAKVILLSKYLYSDVEHYVDKSNVTVCPNGIRNDFYYEAGSRSRGVKVKPKILFLSNLIESKGVYVLLEACSLMKKRGISFICDFVGGEGDISVDQFQKKVFFLGIEDCVAYLGKKFNREKEEIFKQATIFAFPTYYPNECFPLVLLESMKYALPAVSTFEGGIPDIIEDGKTGYLIQQHDAFELAEKLQSLIQNRSLQIEMGEAAHQKFLKEFTIEIFERNLEIAIAELDN